MGVGVFLEEGQCWAVFSIPAIRRSSQEKPGTVNPYILVSVTSLSMRRSAVQRQTLLAYQVIHHKGSGQSPGLFPVPVIHNCPLLDVQAAYIY